MAPTDCPNEDNRPKVEMQSSGGARPDAYGVHNIGLNLWEIFQLPEPRADAYPKIWGRYGVSRRLREFRFWYSAVFHAPPHVRPAFSLSDQLERVVVRVAQGP